MRNIDKRILLYAGFSMFVLLILMLFSSLDNIIVLNILKLHGPFLDSIMLWVTNIGSGVVVFFVITTLFLYKEGKRKWITPIWLGFALSSLIVLLLKLVLVRERPFMILDLDIVRDFAIWDSSFPSWHAAMVFSALPVIDKEFPKIRIFWILFALAVIFSRIYLGYHFLSDIIMGALIGYFSGFLFVKIWEKKSKQKKK